MTTNTIISNNTRYVILDGTYYTTLEQCYNSLQVQLDIPDYFGHNLDALEEVLADLEWVTENVCIIILNHKALLSDAMDKKIDFLDILQQCENEKVQVVIAN